jgi:hypothetical protein
LAIGIALMLLGFAAVGAIRLLGAKGSLAGALGTFAAFALLFADGFVRNGARGGSIFPPSEITRQNRWKYLVLAAVLWIGVFAAWWYAVRLLPK